MHKHVFLIVITICFIITNNSITAHGAALSDADKQMLLDGKIENAILIEDKFILSFDKSKLDGSIIGSRIVLDSEDGEGKLFIIGESKGLTFCIMLTNKKIVRATSDLKKDVVLEYVLDDSGILKDSVCVQDGGIHFIKSVNGKFSSYDKKFLSSLMQKKRLAIRLKIGGNMVEEVFDITGIEKAIEALKNIK